MRRFPLLRLLTIVICTLRVGGAAEPQTPESADVVVVGAGIAGLSAALEAGRGGAQVTVLDMSSVFGGHAVMAQGLLNIVGTQLQADHGVEDSPELAERDFANWGEDVNAEWVRYYARNSHREVYDGLRGLGVIFDHLNQPPGNSVPRGHTVRGRGVALVTPIYRECLQTPTIRFRWNARLDRLVKEHGRIVAVVATDLRTGQPFEVRATAVVLATGGFQSNLDLVREVWPKGLPLPSRVLAGGGIHAMGSALEIARHAGAAIDRLDHQWNYLCGVPDPRFPGSNRGLLVIVPALWVNAEGRRFVSESMLPKQNMPIVLQQPGGTYWAIFGAEALKAFYVSGSDWGDYRVVEEWIVNNRTVVQRAETIDALAQAIGVPGDQLHASVERYNAQIDQGTDEDFHRFGATGPVPPKIKGPPYCAMQYFPLTRKSLGGVTVDQSCRVLDREKTVIPGLYAIGEVAGFGGINGKHGLEGTFLAPSLAMGRVAGRAILGELQRISPPPPTGRETVRFATPVIGVENNAGCLSCHALPVLLGAKRTGYWHFEKVHSVVLAKEFACTSCHAELNTTPAADPLRHRIDPQKQLLTCGICHRGESP